MKRSDSIKELATALAAAQGELKSVAKTGKGNFGKYAELGPSLDQVLPVLSKNGLAVTQHPMNLNDGTTGLITLLMHKSGEWLESCYPVRMQQQTPQGQGSAITYARRYALFAVIGIAGDDDDGQAGSEGNNPEKKRPVSNGSQGYGRDRLASEKQIGLMLARTREATGLRDREQIIGAFVDTFGMKPNEVKQSEIDDVLNHLDSMKLNSIAGDEVEA